MFPPGSVVAPEWTWELETRPVHEVYLPDPAELERLLAHVPEPAPPALIDPEVTRC